MPRNGERMTFILIVGILCPDFAYTNTHTGLTRKELRAAIEDFAKRPSFDDCEVILAFGPEKEEKE